MKASVKTYEEENVIAQTFNRYIPYWPLFLVLLILTLDAAAAYLYMTSPMYESSARILIKDEKKGSEDSKSEEGLNQLSPKKIIENEMDVIQSRTLVDKVVKDLYLYIPVAEESRFRKRAAYASSPVRVTGYYAAKAPTAKKIYFSYDAHTPGVVIDGVKYPLHTPVITHYGQFTFLPNENYSGETTENKLYFQVLDPKAVVASIQERLKVTTANKQSSIITVTLRDEVPQRAEDILNRLMLTYNQATITDKNQVAENTLASVELRLKSVEHDLDSIEKKTELYKSNKGVVDISEEGKLFLQNVSANDQKIGDVNIQLGILDQAEQYVKSKNNTEGYVPSTAGISDPVLPNLIEKLYTLELERESLKKTAGENNFAMTTVTDKIEKIKPSILENIQNQRRTLESSSKNIADANKNYSSLLQTIPQKERDLIEINRALSIKNTIYTFLLQKREETLLSHASFVSDSKVVDAASSGSSPVTPKPKVIYLAAFLLAILVGICIIYAKEAFNQRIMFRDEIKRLSAATVIGEISQHNAKNPVAISHHNRTFIAEQFRKLRASLQFIGITGNKKRLLVTSAISGEGKSFVSLNLSITLALTGKKVLLVDADLHKPSLHTKLNLAPGQGLAEYLKGAAEEEDIIVPSGINPQLFFIGTGRLPDNPSELMMNSRMQDLLNNADSMFDYIVVDSAPVGLVTDAYMISPYCDATIFVIRHNYTPKTVVQQLDEENRINHLNNIGIVFNDVRTRGFGEKYGYGYGHGYVSGKNDYNRLHNA